VACHCISAPFVFFVSGGFFKYGNKEKVKLIFIGWTFEKLLLMLFAFFDLDNSAL